jgi:hypothetical protein
MNEFRGENMGKRSVLKASYFKNHIAKNNWIGNFLKYLIIIFVFVIISCSEGSDSNNNTDVPQTISSVAKEYLNSALDIMQNNSINKYKIEWVSFREETFEFAGNSQTPKDTYPAIKFALNNLGDNHSFFQGPTKKSKSNLLIQSNDEEILSLLNSDSGLIGLRIRENIGFIRIPAFSGTGESMLNFANDIQNVIKEFDSSSVKGWIVDLRHNGGGNMWPMLAGVGPILGNGLAGKFVDADNNVSNWYYEDGKAILEDSIIVEVSNYHMLFNLKPHVAVLTNNRTASSGEAIVVAFRGRPKTRSFGTPTYGVSTANQGYPLSDGAIIYLTVAIMADRKGNLYGQKIVPDEIVKGEFKVDPTDNDIVVNAAIDWLEKNI